MPERKIALYVSSSAVTPELQSQIQHDFDTTPGMAGTTRPGWIEHVPNSKTWSIGLSPRDIHQRHSQEYVPQYPRKPIIILDERTVRDGSVLVVSPALNEETDQFEHAELRFVPRMVPDTAANLVIGNQTLKEVCRWVRCPTRY